MKKSKTQPDLSLSELDEQIAIANSLSKRCKEQFIRNTRKYIGEHPELKGCKIPFDPDYTFQVERSLKHSCNIVCDVVSVGFDETGKIVFDLEGENYSENGVHLHGEVCYGAYVEDWPYALKVLLRHFEDPYIPEEEDGNVEW